MDRKQKKMQRTYRLSGLFWTMLMGNKGERNENAIWNGKKEGGI